MRASALTLLYLVRRQRMAPLEQRTVPAKVCKRCGLTKSASEFYRNKLMSDGLYSHCKVCTLSTSGLKDIVTSTKFPVL